MRLSAPSYLIHGTNDPVGIGKRSTAAVSACILGERSYTVQPL